MVKQWQEKANVLDQFQETSRSIKASNESAATVPGYKFSTRPPNYNATSLESTSSADPYQYSVFTSLNTSSSTSDTNQLKPNVGDELTGSKTSSVTEVKLSTMEHPLAAPVSSVVTVGYNDVRLLSTVDEDPALLPWLILAVLLLLVFILVGAHSACGDKSQAKLKDRTQGYRSSASSLSGRERLGSTMSEPSIVEDWPCPGFSTSRTSPRVATYTISPVHDTPRPSSDSRSSSSSSRSTSWTSFVEPSLEAKLASPDHLVASFSSYSSPGKLVIITTQAEVHKVGKREEVLRKFPSSAMRDIEVLTKEPEEDTTAATTPDDQSITSVLVKPLDILPHVIENFQLRNSFNALEISVHEDPKISINNQLQLDLKITHSDEKQKTNSEPQSAVDQRPPWEIIKQQQTTSTTTPDDQAKWKTTVLAKPYYVLPHVMENCHTRSICNAISMHGQANQTSSIQIPLNGLKSTQGAVKLRKMFKTPSHLLLDPSTLEEQSLTDEESSQSSADSVSGTHRVAWRGSKLGGVRQTKSSLARRTLVQRMVLTGNIHSHCHYPRSKGLGPRQPE